MSEFETHGRRMPAARRREAVAAWAPLCPAALAPPGVLSAWGHAAPVQLGKSRGGGPHTPATCTLRVQTAVSHPLAPKHHHQRRPVLLRAHRSFAQVQLRRGAPSHSPVAASRRS